MTALLSFFAGNPAILGVLASIIAALGWGIHQRLAGARAERVAERARQAVAEASVREVAGQIQNDIGALPAGAARKELKSWARD
ncbi:ABC transporter permease [Mesorhizobium sp.]|uniref:ABC transporter permease n=1 Tax=Mesorhizobium sp. TaxID=1871066 RepID=UPI0011F48F9C|nr:ABC transporter permease [Mesorhizobium sp.]TIS53045.1 MAG: ABC transporter permease [Mesorhizobium sp.]TIS85457.1 MAG: ABC transporter permease [Mesorhizobium sp.]TJW41925.1 MAG: ABC transporter permease [Mesorhizobium sp.]